MQQTSGPERIQWLRASFCSAGNGCVETARIGDTYAIRDGKDPDGPKLLFDRTEWQAFLAGARTGEFDYDPA